jgi:uncharacterized membrane protein YdjX (TVP38/TMEM64 family)
MNNIVRTFLFAFALLIVPTAQAQSSMDESFHANGSIRVVVAVAAIVLAGLFVFIFSLERRLKKLEKKD